jgi:hypothetical protein
VIVRRAGQKIQVGRRFCKSSRNSVVEFFGVAKKKLEKATSGKKNGTFEDEIYRHSD